MAVVGRTEHDEIPPELSTHHHVHALSQGETAKRLKRRGGLPSSLHLQLRPR